MQKKRLYLITNDYPNRGGDSNFIRYEVMRLREEFDVVNICLSARDAAATDVNENTVFAGYSTAAILKYIPYLVFDRVGRQEIKHVFKSGGSMLLKLRRIISSARVFAGSEWFIRTAGDIFKDAPKDSVIYSYWNDYSILGMLRMKDKNPGFRYVSRIHGCDLYDERVPSLRQPFKWFMNDMLDKLVFIGQNSMDYYIEHHPELEADKYELCRLGVEPVSDAAKHDSKEFVVVSCSRLIPLKRVDLIIEGLKKLNCKCPVKWIHFGDGELFDEISSKAAQCLDDLENVSYELRGNADNAAVRDFYRDNVIGCFITTSETEGCPVSVMEVMAAGIPVIGTAVGDIPHMIDDSGVLLDENPTPEMIAEAIESVAEKYALRAENDEFMALCNNSKKLYNKMFNVEVNTEHFIDRILLNKR